MAGNHPNMAGKNTLEKFKVAKHKVALSWTDYEKSDFWERTLQSIK